LLSIDYYGLSSNHRGRCVVASYSIGNYLGTIAICGMLSEMSILLLYDIILTAYKNNPSRFPEKPIQYEEFEKYIQASREEYIKKFIGKKEIVEHSKAIRQIRRKYLHFFKIDYSDIESDAISAFEYIINMLTIVTGLGISSSTPGAIALDPDFLFYIKQKGFIANPRNKSS